MKNLYLFFLQSVKNFDMRVLWGIRHLFYKIIAGRLKGLGYLGKPSFVKGIKNFYAESGLGIFPGWRIEIISNGKVFFGKNIRVGNNFFLNSGSEIFVGDRVVISSDVFIGTTDYIIDANPLHSFKDWPVNEKKVFIGRNCFIGVGAKILPGTILNDNCVVGAGAIVKGTFKAGSVIAGNPAKIIRNRLGG